MNTRLPEHKDIQHITMDESGMDLITLQGKLSVDYYNKSECTEIHIDVPCPVSSTLVDEIIRYYEDISQRENKPLRFAIFGMTYRHPSYMDFSGLHSKEPFCHNPAIHPVIRELYTWCIEEEERDFLFSFSFYLAHDSVDFYWVKGGMKYETHVRYVTDEVEITHSDSDETTVFVSVEEAAAYIRSFVDQQYRKDRLSTVFDTPWYYAKEALQNKRFDENLIEKTIQHLMSQHEEEAIEHFFKQNSQHLFHYRQLSECGLIQLMDEWLLYDISQEEVSLIWFKQEDRKKAIVSYEQRVLQDIFGTECYDTMQSLKTSP